LRAEVEGLRASNERMDQRLSRLEDRQAVAQARAPVELSTTEDAPEETVGEVLELKVGHVPELTVVKMKPRADKAPPLDTSTQIQEPMVEEVAALARLRRAGRDTDAPEVADPNDPELVEAEFEAALAGLKTGSFASAVQKLESFASAHARHALSDNALYYSGIGLLAMEDASGAARAFERVIAEYPAGDARIDAMLKLADCRLRLDQKDGARELYARILSTYPGSPAAEHARQRLAKLSP
jgi:tol-pal system protein YbgF